MFYYMFLLYLSNFSELPFPHTFLFVIILFLLFEEPFYYVLSLTLICTLVEMIAGYICINLIIILSHTKTALMYSFMIRLDCCLFLLEIAISFAMWKKRKNHAKYLHEIDAKGYGFLLLSACFPYALSRWQKPFWIL